MRRIVVARLAGVLPLMLIAACEGGGGPTPLPTPSVTASFPPHGIADVIVIDAADRLPLRQAALVLPDGETVPAQSVDVNARPRFSRNITAFEGGIGGPGELTLPGPIAPASIRSEGEVLITLSKAAIALPDPVAYRRDWTHYRIRLDFGTPPGEVESRIITAPEPSAP